MKEFINRVIRNTDVHKLEKLLVILIPVLTLVIIASIIMPTVALLRSGSDTQDCRRPFSGARSRYSMACSSIQSIYLYYNGKNRLYNGRFRMIT